MTVEGWEVWDVIERSAGQLRMGPMGPVGLDFTPIFQISGALGYSATGLAELLPSAEAGMMRGLLRRMTRNDDGQS